ncbi:hypothetical protein BBJ28_00012638 [Nothophytophthora sp. Chile5]|nr:hypothetical protein BBJ28_00012638 [Nothophytophthora sp. Chile5]
MFSCDTMGKPLEDQYVHMHSNRLCVVGVAASHPVMQEELESVEFAQHILDSRVTGKKKKGGRFLLPNTALCVLKCKSGREFTLFSCIRGSLIEVNERLQSQPTLLQQKVRPWLRIRFLLVALVSDGSNCSPVAVVLIACSTNPTAIWSSFSRRKWRSRRSRSRCFPRTNTSTSALSRVPSRCQRSLLSRKSSLQIQQTHRPQHRRPNQPSNRKHSLPRRRPWKNRQQQGRPRTRWAQHATHADHLWLLTKRRMAGIKEDRVKQNEARDWRLSVGKHALHLLIRVTSLRLLLSNDYVED